MKMRIIWLSVLAIVVFALISSIFVIDSNSDIGLSDFKEKSSVFYTNNNMETIGEDNIFDGGSETEPEEKEDATFTPSTETRCKGETCNLVLYSGTRFADDKGTLIEEAKSLKENEEWHGIRCIVDYDGEHIAECLDYNYTHRRISRSMSALSLSDKTKVPIKIYKRNGTLISSKKEDLTVEKDGWIKADFGDVVHIGEKSTTISLQAPNTQNMDDAYTYEGTSDQNVGTSLFVQLDATDAISWRKYSFFKFNISSIPSEQNIIDGVLSLYMYSNTLDSASETCKTDAHWIYDNFSWNEHTITWNTQPETDGERDPFSMDDITFDGNSPVGWYNWNVTYAVNQSYLESNYNTSIGLYTSVPGDSISDGVTLYAKEAVGSFPKLIPMLNITYETGVTPDTTATSFSDNSTNASTDTYNGTDVQLNLTISDDTAVDWYRLSHNDTGDGTWTNESLVDAGETSPVTAIFNYSIVNFSTNGGTFGWRVWANDTAGNSNVSQIRTFKVRDIPHYEIHLLNSTNFNVTQNQTFIFSVNVSCDSVSDCGFINLTLDPANWWNSGWNRRKEITIEGVGTLSNFPAYLNITYDSDMQADYDDLRFINGSCGSGQTAEMAYEIENSTATNAHIWINTSLIDNNITICMYYGNPSATNGENVNAVWDNNYVMVHHLQETDIDGGAGDIKDSTANGNDGTTDGSMNSADQVAGKIDGSFDFDESDDYTDHGDINALDGLTGLTVSGWVKWEGTVSNMGGSKSIIRKQTTGDVPGVFALGGGWDTAPQNLAGFYVYDGSWIYSGDGTTNIADGNLHYVAGVYDNVNVIIYVDGKNETKAPHSTALASDTDKVYIGGYDNVAKNNPLELWNGVLDEIRASNTARSTAWINQTYQMTNNPSAFVTFGNEEDRKGGAIPQDTGTPFFINTSLFAWNRNPTNVTLNAGEYAIINWSVYANGTVENNYTFFVYGNSTDFDNRSLDVNVTIVAPAVDSISPTVSLITPTNNTYYTTSNSIDFNYSATDDTAVTNCTLYINNTFNQSNDGTLNFTGTNISNGNYHWFINCSDAIPNWGYSGFHNLTIEYTPPDTDFPDYSNWQNNASTDTYQNGVVNFSITMTDETGLNMFFFADNQSGTMTNKTNSTISGTSYFLNYSDTITASAGGFICAEISFNDTSNNVNLTNQSCFTVQTPPDTTNPESNISVNNTQPKINDIVNISMNVSDNIGLNYCWFFNNQSNSNSSLISISGTSDTSLCYNITQINLTRDNYILFRGYVNDTSGNLNYSDIYVTVDNTAPSTPTIYYPNNGGTYLNITNINFSSSDSDGDSITYYGYINGTLNFTTTTNITTWNASNGYYNLTIFAGDGTDNSSNTTIYFTQYAELGVVLLNTTTISVENQSNFIFCVNTSCNGTCGYTNTYVDPISYNNITFVALEGDGTVQGFGVGVEWDTVHDSSSGNVVDYTDTVFYPMTYTFNDTHYYIRRVFLPFNTSSLPDNAVILSGNITIKTGNTKKNEDNDGIDYLSVIGNTSQVSINSLENDDYNDCGTIDNPVIMSDKKDLTNMNVNTEYTFILNSNGTSAISLTGNTLFGIREGHDIEDSPIYAGVEDHIQNYMFILSQNSTNSIEDRPTLRLYYRTSTVYDKGGLIPNSSGNPFYINTTTYEGNPKIDYLKDNHSVVCYDIYANGTEDTFYDFFAYANSTDGLLNQQTGEVQVNITTPPGPVDTCECSSIQAGATVDCTENCDVEVCDASGQNITFSGSGTVEIIGNITNHGTVRIINGCIVKCLGACFKTIP